MKQRILILFWLFFFCVLCKAELLNINDIQQIGASFLNTDSIVTVKKETAYTILKPKTGTGYVIVNNDGNASKPILCFSKEEIWDESLMPSMVLQWLDYLDDQDETIEEARGKSTIITESERKKSISPLLTCHWHQNSPYNDLSPIIEDGHVKTVAGCVAIAAAQIIYYWRKDNPEVTMKNSPTYIYGGAPVTMSIPKGTPNNWELIKDEYFVNDSEESKAAVAQLCYVIGTTSYLNYASSTGGSISNASNAMYSQYRLLSEYISKTKCTQEEWENLIYNEISNGRPVLCSGDSGTGLSGHAFVLDGYDSETGLYHFNLGWGGSGDAYYAIDDSRTAFATYFKNQTIVYDIHPLNRRIDSNITSGINKGKSVAKINIVNGSTLPLKEIYVFASSTKQIPSANDTAMWEGYEVCNDGKEYTFDVPIDETYEGNTIYLTLTDENRTVLCQSFVEVVESLKRIADANNVVNYYLGFSTECLNTKIADMDNDGNITISDANEIVNRQLNR